MQIALRLSLAPTGATDACEAAKMNRRAIEGYGKTLGKQHPDTLTSLSNLADVLSTKGEYETAKERN
jgi:hypothetical protein